MEWAKVLLVDQEQGGYEALGQELIKHGYQMHITAKVTKALALVDVHRYEVALVSLPLIKETALLPQLNAEYPDLPLIIVLPCDYADCLSPQLLQSAIHVIGKPLQLDRVRLMLDRTLELIALRTRVRQHRLAWYDTLARLTSSELDSPEDDPEIPLDMVWESKLRYIVPNLEAVGGGSLHRTVLSYVERLLLTIVLREFRGNQVRASEVLGINRNTLRKKIRDFGLTIPRGGA